MHGLSGRTDAKLKVYSAAAMYLLYTFFLIAGLLVTSPYYLIRFRRYSSSLKDRFGFIDVPPLKHSIWVHAVSVGEVKAVQKLLEGLRKSYPGSPIILSTITPAGQKLARDSSGLADHIFYFPLDFPGAVRRTLNHLDPKLVIIAETEIWPNFLRECRRRGIEVMMVNGRISDRSFPRYRLVRHWLKRVLDDYTLLGMQSELDRERIETIGANRVKVTVFGNLKYDALTSNRRLDDALIEALSKSQPLWIAASTMPGEEEQVLGAFAQVRERHPALRLLIAPRHPERFDAVEQLVRSQRFRCSRRTRLEREADVILLDSIGELASVFQYGDVVFVGGTLVPRGGHNVLEPAVWGKPIVFGPNMQNFREISELFLNARAAVQVQDASALAATVDRLLSDRAMAAELGGAARRLVESKTGATERVLAFLQPTGSEKGVGR
jgi:3-deoxy-D-manno-octulosonic-acid transferase